MEQRKKHSDIEEFYNKIKRRKYGSSFNLSLELAYLLEGIVKSHGWESIIDLFLKIKRIAKKLAHAAPMELYISNIFKRALHIIREECKNYNIPLDKILTEARNYIDSPTRINRSVTIIGFPDSKLINEKEISPWLTKTSNIEKSIESLTSLVKVRSTAEDAISLLDESNYIKQLGNKKEILRERVLEGVTGLIDELEGMKDLIAKQATDHIFPNEAILTYGWSKTVLAFILVSIYIYIY